MRLKARGLAQHGGLRGWLEDSNPTGVILYKQGKNRNKIITHKWHVQKTNNPQLPLSETTIPNIRHLPDPPPFSLQSTFKVGLQLY
jgi:hypothetical protein